MLSFLDKILTFFIDHLYLQRTKVRLRIFVKAAQEAPQYSAPYPEAVDNSIGQFGLTREQLAVHMGNGRNTDAALKH